MTEKRAVVVLSGGMDSVTVLAHAHNEGYICNAITFDYGQRSSSEIHAAEYYSKTYKCCEHKIYKMSFNDFSNSALINESMHIDASNINNNKIPNTYVPLRNIIFLSIACSWAESMNIHNIFLGVNSVDYSGYPDCRPEFISKYQDMLNAGTKTGVEDSGFKIHTPLINMKKTDIIKLGHSIGVNYYHSVSCYQALDTGEACGNCESCEYRKNAFIEAGLEDETKYY